MISSQGLMLILQHPHFYMTTGHSRDGSLHAGLLDHVRLNTGGAPNNSRFVVSLSEIWNISPFLSLPAFLSTAPGGPRTIDLI